MLRQVLYSLKISFWGRAPTQASVHPMGVVLGRAGSSALVSVTQSRVSESFRNEPLHKPQS